MSVSGLTAPQRHEARKIAVQAALLSLHHAPKVHYTQGPQRWSGIAHRLVAAKGEYPTEADCSSSVSWWLWNALHHHFGLPDIVNGDRWNGGYTGTLAQHGRQVQHLHNVIRGDVVLYGPAPTFEHTAMVVGHEHGVPVVVSHGSEAGPFLLPFNYRSDGPGGGGQFRRMI